VGIGETTPDTSALHVKQNKGSAGDVWTQVGPGNNMGITLQNSSTTDNTNSVIYFKNDTDYVAAIGARYVDHSTNETELRFSVTDGSGTSREKMYLKGDGKLGIGTPTPSATLDVNGTLKIAKHHPEFLTATCTGAFVNGCAVNTWHAIAFSGVPNLNGYLGGYAGGYKGFHFELFWTGGSTSLGYNHSVVGWVPPRSNNTSDSYRNSGNSSYITHNSGSTSYEGVPITVGHHTAVIGTSDIRIRLVALSGGGALTMQVFSNTSPNSSGAKITIWRA
jgi:hypothetical protein